jgi:hypothetical protein
MRMICLGLLLVGLAACGNLGATPTPTFARFTADEIVGEFRAHYLEVENAGPMQTPAGRELCAAATSAIEFRTKRQSFVWTCAFASAADLDAGVAVLNRYQRATMFAATSGYINRNAIVAIWLLGNERADLYLTTFAAMH